jgi:hypothetical protein
MGIINRSKMPLARRFFSSRDYVWIKFRMGDKYGILGPFRDDEDAQDNALDQLRGVVFDLFHLKTKDKKEATKALNDKKLGNQGHSGMGDRYITQPDDDEHRKVRFV